MQAHHFTVDVEEYFQVSAFEGQVPRERWRTLESRVCASVRLLLEMLAHHHVCGTFFVLGWVADHCPDLVREIARERHEIASHGWDHKRVTSLRPEEFRASVRRTKRSLEDLTGTEVAGFRAPSYSIVPGFEWAFDVLIEEGYRYDSSLYPVRRPGGYGYPGTVPHPHWIHRKGGKLAEFPPATLRRFGMSIPAGGGAYFRILPYALTQSALRDCERRGEPATFYVHPWEVDPAQPRFDVPWLTRLRHYTGLRGTEQRLHRLLREFRFARIADTVVAA
jgi:polysaccharide deacetylase family protein (PEP-CTERM system associated)